MLPVSQGRALRVAFAHQRRVLHFLSPVRRLIHPSHLPSGSETLQINGVPLTPKEAGDLRGLTAKLADDFPEVARALLLQLGSESERQQDGSGMIPARSSERGFGTQQDPISLSNLSKVAGAKLQRRQGKGKTAMFSYLSDVDKTRVLHLARGSEAELVAAEKKGRTAFFANLPGEVKYAALRSWQQERGAESGEAPTGELFKVFLSQGVPMIGFGLADNGLMILFGESIDAKFGLYVSTMAAAGLGNLCSNIVGLGLADYIEHASAKMGVPQPRLSPAQRETGPVRAAGFLGTTVGVTVGCLLGMTPLLLRTDKEAAPE